MSIGKEIRDELMEHHVRLMDRNKLWALTYSIYKSDECSMDLVDLGYLSACNLC